MEPPRIALTWPAWSLVSILSSIYLLSLSSVLLKQLVVSVGLSWQNPCTSNLYFHLEPISVSALLSNWFCRRQLCPCCQGTHSWSHIQSYQNCLQTPWSHSQSPMQFLEGCQGLRQFRTSIWRGSQGSNKVVPYLRWNFGVGRVRSMEVHMEWRGIDGVKGVYAGLWSRLDRDWCRVETDLRLIR